MTRFVAVSIDTGSARVSFWHHGVWAARLAGVLSFFVILCGIADIRLLRAPAIASVAVIAAGLSLTGIALCLWGLKRRSKRFRLPSFWSALVGCMVVLAVLSVMYRRVIRMPQDKIAEVNTQPQ